MNKKQRKQVLEWLPKAILELREIRGSEQPGLTGAIYDLSDIAYHVNNDDEGLISEDFEMDGTETISELYEKMYA